MFRKRKKVASVYQLAVAFHPWNMEGGLKPKPRDLTDGSPHYLHGS